MLFIYCKQQQQQQNQEQQQINWIVFCLIDYPKSFFHSASSDLFFLINNMFHILFNQKYLYVTSVAHFVKQIRQD